MEAPGNLGRALGLEAEAVQENVVHFELLALETSAAGEGAPCLEQLAAARFAVEDPTGGLPCQPRPLLHAGLSEEAARGLRVQLLEHTLRWTAGHLWQRGCWDLHISRLHPASWHGGGGASTQRRGAGAAAGQGGRAAPDQQGAAEAAPDLWGSMAFGDNVEDEWFVVWLLLELTRAFPVTARSDLAGLFPVCHLCLAWPLLYEGNGAVIAQRAPLLRPSLASSCILVLQQPLIPHCRVWDNDGEFLLIEAAYSLPRWLKPESAANRVGGLAGCSPRSTAWSTSSTSCCAAACKEDE